MKWAPSKRSTKFSKPICNAIVIPSIEIKYWSKITPIDIKLTTKFKFLNVQHPTYCWPQRISSAYPVPKLKHIIFGIHSEFSYLSLICWKGYEMFGNSTFLLIQKLINNYVWYMYHEIITINYFLQFWSANWKLTSFEVSRSHIFAVVALVIVSWVVKVLDAMTKSVVSGLHFFNVTV